MKQKTQTFVDVMRDHEIINEKTHAYLNPTESRTPQFYCLPKIHKENNPGRPIVSGNNSPTENLSKFVDKHLRPLVQNVPTYIQDTTHFLRKLNEIELQKPNPSDPNYHKPLLVTLDVKSLYTNIPHEEGLDAIKDALETRINPKVPTNTLVEATRLILKSNNFDFNNKHYLQVSGTAMGTSMAPSYANLFLGKWESKFWNEQDKTPDLNCRFIDDVFLI